MTPQRPDVYRFRTGYLKFKSVLCDRNTGLVSYRLFLDDVRRFFETRETVAVIVAEVLHLSRVETIYGWQACDDLLVVAAKAFRDVVESHWGESAVLAQDAIYEGRYVLFIPQEVGQSALTATDVGRFAAIVRDALNAAFAGPEFEGMTPAVAIQAGGTVLRENPFLRFERQLSDAVQVAVPVVHETDQAEPAITTALRAIINEERIAVVFQPVLDLSDGRTVGHEAIAAGSPGTGLESAAALFACGDRSGLAAELDRVCRQRACQQAADLSHDGLVFVRAVPATLDGGHDAALSFLMTRTGRQPDQIVLQVAEQRLHDMGEAEQKHVAAMRSMGFRLALDNAGTGFATLKLIEELRPAYVKIDATLVRGVDGNLLQQEVIRSVVAVAQRVDCAVVAPGVESADEAATVRRCGVRLAQGNHLAPPAPLVAARPPEQGSYGGVPGP